MIESLHFLLLTGSDLIQKSYACYLLDLVPSPVFPFSCRWNICVNWSIILCSPDFIMELICTQARVVPMFSSTDPKDSPFQVQFLVNRRWTTYHPGRGRGFIEAEFSKWMQFWGRGITSSSVLMVKWWQRKGGGGGQQVFLQNTLYRPARWAPLTGCMSSAATMMSTFLYSHGSSQEKYSPPRNCSGYRLHHLSKHRFLFLLPIGSSREKKKKKIGKQWIGTSAYKIVITPAVAQGNSYVAWQIHQKRCLI